jgi:hypothetical protein
MPFFNEQLFGKYAQGPSPLDYLYQGASNPQAGPATRQYVNTLLPGSGYEPLDITVPARPTPDSDFPYQTMEARDRAFAPPGSLQAQMSMGDVQRQLQQTDQTMAPYLALGQQLQQTEDTMSPYLKQAAENRKPEDYSGVRAGAYQFGSTPIDTSNFESMRDGLEANRYEMDMLGNSIDRREFDRNASMEDDIRRRAMEAKLDSLSPYVTGEPGFSGSGASNDPFRNNSFATPYTKGQMGQLEMDLQKERAEQQGKERVAAAPQAQKLQNVMMVMDKYQHNRKQIEASTLDPATKAQAIRELDEAKFAALSSQGVSAEDLAAAGYSGEQPST